MNQPLKDMKFEVSPEGVGFSSLMGERFEESYMALVRLPAEPVSPPHTKSANMFGIVISGGMTHTAMNDAGEATVLTAGSYYRIPAGLAHVSTCVSDVECITFVYQDGKFDFNVVTE